MGLKVGLKENLVGVGSLRPVGGSEKSTPLLPTHRAQNGPGWESEVGKENYRALPRAKHSIRLFWAKLWILGLKRELSRGRLFKAC